MVYALETECPDEFRFVNSQKQVYSSAFLACCCMGGLRRLQNCAFYAGLWGF